MLFFVGFFVMTMTMQKWKVGIHGFATKSCSTWSTAQTSWHKNVCLRTVLAFRFAEARFAYLDLRLLANVSITKIPIIIPGVHKPCFAPNWRKKMAYLLALFGLFGAHKTAWVLYAHPVLNIRFLVNPENTFFAWFDFAPDFCVFEPKHEV